MRNIRGICVGGGRTGGYRWTRTGRRGNFEKSAPILDRGFVHAEDNRREGAIEFLVLGRRAGFGRSVTVANTLRNQLSSG